MEIYLGYLQMDFHWGSPTVTCLVYPLTGFPRETRWDCGSGLRSGFSTASPHWEIQTETLMGYGSGWRLAYQKESPHSATRWAKPTDYRKVTRLGFCLGFPQMEYLHSGSLKGCQKGCRLVTPKGFYSEFPLKGCLMEKPMAICWVSLPKDCRWETPTVT